jgi:hypothetical protein
MSTQPSAAVPEYEWITDQIFTVDGFLSSMECRAEIAKAEAAGFDAAPINGRMSISPRLRRLHLSGFAIPQMRCPG